MATASAAPLEALTKLTTDFVSAQKGTWDHKAWMGFLSQVKRRGIALSEEMQARLGDLLEATKQYREAVSATDDIEKAVGRVLEESAAFIKRQQGVWGHDDWQDFLRTIQRNTHTWSEGMEAYLGGVLESLRVFYRLPPAAAAKKATSARTVASVKKATPAAPKNALRRASPAKARKKSGTEKTG